LSPYWLPNIEAWDAAIRCYAEGIGRGDLLILEAYSGAPVEDDIGWLRETNGLGRYVPSPGRLPAAFGYRREPLSEWRLYVLQ